MKKSIIIIMIFFICGCFSDKKKLSGYEIDFIEKSKYFEIYIVDDDYDMNKIKISTENGNVIVLILKRDLVSVGTDEIKDSDVEAVRNIIRDTQIKLLNRFGGNILFLDNPIERFVLKSVQGFPIWESDFYYKDSLDELNKYLETEGFTIHKIYFSSVFFDTYE